jgi:sugar phosphate permease
MMNDDDDDYLLFLLLLQKEGRVASWVLAGVSAVEGWQHFFTPFSICTAAASYLIVITKRRQAEQIKKK